MKIVNSRVQDNELFDCKENVTPDDIVKYKSIAQYRSDLVNESMQPLNQFDTPVRRSTFVKARSTPPCESNQNILNFEGQYLTENGSPVAIPDSLTTPVRRTTFVKRTSKSTPDKMTNVHGSPVGQQSAPTCQDLPRFIHHNVEVRHIPPSGIMVQSAMQQTFCIQENYACRGSAELELYKDVCQSPQLLEEKLLGLKERQLARRSGSAGNLSRQTSPGSDSEYHTATMTTPFDVSLDSCEFQDSIVCAAHDSVLLSDTITCDEPVCQTIGLNGFRSGVIEFDTSEVVVCGSEDNGNVLKDFDSECITMMGDETYRVDRQRVDEKFCTLSDIIEEQMMTEEVMTCRIQRVELCKDDLCQSEFGKQCQEELLMYNPDKAADKRMSSTPAMFKRDLGSNALNMWLPRASAPSPINISSLVVSVTERSDLDDGCFRRPLPAGAAFRSQSVPAPRKKSDPLPGNDSLSASDSENEPVIGRTFIKPKLNDSRDSVDCNSQGRKALSRHLFVEENGKVGINCTWSEGITPLDASQIEDGDKFGCLDDCTNTGAHTDNLARLHITHQIRSSRDENSSCGSCSEDDAVKTLTKRSTSMFVQVGGQTCHLISPGQKRQSLIAKIGGVEDRITCSHDPLELSARNRNMQVEGSLHRSRSLNSSESSVAKKATVREKSYDSHSSSKLRGQEPARNIKRKSFVRLA